jgi:hypothetical protein
MSERPRPKPSSSSRRTVRTDLDAVLDRLHEDELRVILSIAGRLRVGARLYGQLQLATDRRAFRKKEAREELEDFLVYLACAWLKVLESSSNPAPAKRATRRASRSGAASRR